MKYNTIYFIIKDNVWFDFIGNLMEVYKNRFSLAQYFQGRGDKWLSDHFFQTCLDVSSQEQGGEQRLCEALCFVGLAMEENGRDKASC